MGDPIRLGRYSLFAKLAAGGMATVYLGRLDSDAGFGRIVAIKRLHPFLARQTEFARMFLDEARLAARVRHPNVAPMLDVVESDGELFLVMEYIRGASLSSLLKETLARSALVPVPVVVSCMLGVLNGLHAAHEARDEFGRPLSIVHRDVSPQNVMVGADGVTRVLDFGVAKAAVRLQTTRDGALKGKLAYMAPEQIAGNVSRATDVYASGVVLWESLTCRRLHGGGGEIDTMKSILESKLLAPSSHNPAVSAELDRITARALARDPAVRYATALEMARELDGALRPASTMEVAEWVLSVASEDLAERDTLVAEVEGGSAGSKATSFEDVGSLPKPQGAPPFAPFRSAPDVATTVSPGTSRAVESAGGESAPRPVRKRGRVWLVVSVGLATLLGIAGTTFVWKERSSFSISGARASDEAGDVAHHRWLTACEGKNAGDPCDVEQGHTRYAGKCWSIKSRGGVLGCNRLNAPP